MDCKTETKSKFIPENFNKNLSVTDTVEGLSEDIINIVEKKLIGKEIIKKNKIENLKLFYKNSLERDIERPYMWDVFTASNDTLLHFYEYKRDFNLDQTNFKSYYLKINYEDGNYDCIMLINENSKNLYNAVIVYENLESEEEYERSTIISNNKLKLEFRINGTEKRIQIFQVKEGLFLEYLLDGVIEKSWDNEYQLKGKVINNLKNGYWIEKKYSIDYGKTIIEDGNYVDGIKDGAWNYSPDGPVDKVIVYKNGEFIRTYYP